MNSQQIQYFFSASKSLSFTKVAEEFYTSQPTVSRQIAALEEELGFSLFHRNGKQLRLTPGGMIMLSEFSKQEAALEEATARVGRIQQGLEGHLTVGYLTGLDTDYYVYPPSMAFADKYPNVTVDMDSGSFRFLRQRLLSGEYDIIFTYFFELPAMNDVLAQKIYTSHTNLIFSSRHPLAGKEDILFEDILGQTLIVPSPEDSEGRAPELKYLLRRAFHRPEDENFDIKLHFADSLETKMFLIRAGRGVGVTGSCMSYAYDMRYTTLPLVDDASIYAVWRKDNLNPTIPLYLDVLSGVSEIDVFNSWIK